MELSARFYAGLSSGTSLQTAYNEAAAAVMMQRDGANRSVQVRDMVQEEAAEHTGRWPWALYLKEGAEIVGAWSLSEAAGDPLFGLPPLPEQDLPETPYRHLNWFREEDAEVFFGRGREIRDLYERVTASATSPILLLYGHSGVGKSSLLAAGLGPRLVGTHTVRYARRERERGLAGTLADMLETEPGDIAAAWHALEGATGQPLIMILDQAEELYTRPLYTRLGDPGEMAAFLEVLTDLFADRARRPGGKLVLAFRKEWLADLEARLSEARLPRSKVYLERLGRAGIMEIVSGPARAGSLWQKYGLTVEDGLAVLIADDLLEDRDAPVAPTLEILLTKMWDRAFAQNPDAPAFTADRYQKLKRGGLLLDDFLVQQLAALRDWNAEAVDSGLALDVLAYHTTSLGTAERRTRAEVEAAYGHRNDVLADLLRQCEDRYLLVGRHDRDEDGAEVAATRLVHDTLAPLVRERHKESDKPGQRAERILESRAVDWKDGQAGAPLDRVDLGMVEAGKGGMRDWSEAERRLITASEESALRIAYRSTSQTLAALAPRRRGLDEHGSHRQVLLLARQAYAFIKNYEGPMFGIIDNVLREALRSGGIITVLTGHKGVVESVAFSPDGKRLASGSWDGTVRLWRLDDPAAAPTVLTGHEDYVSSVAFSPDGKRLASGSQDRTVRLWPLEIKRFADAICDRVDRNLTHEEWDQFIGEELPYVCTCPDLPPGEGTGLDECPER